MGFSNMADYGYTDEHGQFVVDLSGCTRDQLAAIQEVTTEVVREGKGEDARRIVRTKIKLYGKRQPLIDMGKEIGMFTDRKSIDNNVVPPEVQAQRDAARARVREMLKDDEERKFIEHQQAVNGKANGSDNGEGH